MNRFCLSFDIEEFDLPELGAKIDEKLVYSESFEGTKKILRLLDKFSLTSTFFVTTKFAKKYPSLIKSISKKHEIALHGYKHDSNYSEMEDSEAFEELLKAKKGIEKIISKKIYGFRAPRMMAPSIEVLKDLKIKYDSSLHPTYVPGRYNNFFKNRKVHIEDGLIRFPISVTPLLKIPFSWIWFRNFGLNYAKICTLLSFINNDVVDIYMHPWEFQNLEKYNLPRIIKRNTGLKLRNCLKDYLAWCISKKFKFVTMSDYIHFKGI